MSGIVGSKLNIRGSGLIGSLGTDGQHLLSAGAGVSNVFETVAAGGGKIGQVFSIAMVGKQGIATETHTTLTDGTTTFTQAITPAASSSKILLMCNLHCGQPGDCNGMLQFYRDSTAIAVATGLASNREAGTMSIGYGGVNANEFAPVSMTFLDAPSTTSEITYYVKGWNADVDNLTFYINRTNTNDAADAYGDGISNFVVMEVLA